MGIEKKCLGSTEPEPVNGRGPGAAKAPVECGGNTLFRGMGGEAPRLKTNLGILETSLLPLSAQKLWKPSFFALKLKHQNQHFITFSITQTSL